MAITRSQQAKQLLQKGGRARLKVGGQSPGPRGQRGGSNTGPSGGASRDTGSDYGQFDRITERQRKQDLRDLATRQAEDRAEEAVEVFRNRKRNSPFINKALNLIPGIGAVRRIGSMLGPLNNRDFFLDKEIAPENFYSLSTSDQEKMFSEYMSDRGEGKIDAYGNPMYRDNNNIFIPKSPMEEIEEKEIEEEDVPISYRFMADGGRAAFQEGGIMPRLNQLGSGVSSAEQMLQGINQKLESAESNLGEGSGNTAPIGSGSMQLAGNATQQPAFGSMEEAYSSFQDKAKNIRAGGMLGKDNPRVVLPGEMSFKNFSNNMNLNTGFFGMHGAGGVPAGGNNMQSPLASAMRNMAANNGRATLAGGGMPEYQGGIMDLESGRQQYFLGKLVKKAARAVKKVAKSPFGKVALLGLGAGMAGFGPAAGLFGGGKGLAFKQMLLGGKSKGLLGGAIDYAKSNPLKTIAAASGLAGLLTSQEEEDEGLDRGEGIDIEAIRNSPYRYLAPRFMADGGRIGYAEGSKEPVAKETMPLLDMNNQEMDLRAEGGFVPIGRMEKADDVPARLSKNEFVFTADAVRNAGNGSVDKGAEVMYNTMKNLENGGKISKKSQGLEGIL